MDEAEELCDRVAVVDHGNVIACDSPGKLVAEHGGEVTVTFTAEEADCGWMSRVPCVQTVTRVGTKMEVRGEGAIVAHVAASLLQHGIEPIDLRVRQPNLEDVFLRLTGRRSGD